MWLAAAFGMPPTTRTMADRGSGSQRPIGGHASTGHDDSGQAGATNPDQDGGSVSRWRLRDWSVRSRLLVVLLVSTVAVVVLGGLRVATEASEAGALGQTAGQLELSAEVGGLIEGVQAERTGAARFIVGGRSEVAAFTTTGAGTSSTAQRVVGMAEDGRSLGTGVEGAYEAARQRIDNLPGLRTIILTTEFPEAAATTAYTGVVESLLDLDREIARSSGDAGLTREATTVGTVAEIKEQIALQHATLLAASTRGSMQPAQADVMRSTQAELGAATTQLQGNADPSQVQQFNDTVSGPQVDQRSRLAQEALVAENQGRRLGIAPPVWDAAAGGTADLVRNVESSLLDRLVGAARERSTGATTTAIVDALLIVLALLAALAVVVLVARSMLRPLQILRRSALDVASRQLPAAIREIETSPAGQGVPVVRPVPVDSADEIGQVARAFDAVHREAVTLAGTQALLRGNISDILVNLSRRSQSLVEGLLRRIDDMEGREDDPEAMASLFELDHLATRMRRNSENLLILGGAELGRRIRTPVPAVDVLRAAVSEVESYQRVVLRAQPVATIAGRAVNDVIHLVAELLDNAAGFSAPDTTVFVDGSRGVDSSMTVTITDYGVGMDEETLVALNATLAAPPEVDVEVARRMGLYVVGRLGARRGITVVLSSIQGGDGTDHRDSDGESAPVSGTIAAVTIPADLLTEDVDTTPIQVDPATGPVASFQPELSLPGPRQPDPAEGPGPDTVEPRPEAARATWSAEPGSRAPHVGLSVVPTVPPPGAVPEAASGTQSGSSSLFTPNRASETESVAGSPVETDDTRPTEAASEGPAPRAPRHARDRDEVAVGDAPSPIFDQMLSAWFQEHDAAPVPAELNAENTTETVADPRSEDAVAVSGPPVGGAEPNPIRPLPRAPGEPTSPEPAVAVSEPVGTASGGGSAWQFPADEGRRAAEVLDEPVTAGTTGAGLPRRRRGAYLIPGDANGETAHTATRDRDAGSVRGLLAGYQQGLRRGREARGDHPDESSAPPRDEPFGVQNVDSDGQRSPQSPVGRGTTGR